MNELNSRLEKMLTLFHDETENGKLYINYPMVEAIRYTKQLPDLDYFSYTIGRKECQESSFKDIASKFSYYASLDFILMPANREPREEEVRKVGKNWDYLKTQNVGKANYVCNGSIQIPAEKDMISQDKIFKAQQDKFITTSESVSILCSFPLFLYEYFR